MDNLIFVRKSTDILQKKGDTPIKDRKLVITISHNKHISGRIVVFTFRQNLSLLPVDQEKVSKLLRRALKSNHVYVLMTG